MAINSRQRQVLSAISPVRSTKPTRYYGTTTVSRADLQDLLNTPFYMCNVWKTKIRAVLRRGGDLLSVDVNTIVDGVRAANTDQLKRQIRSKFPAIWPVRSKAVAKGKVAPAKPVAKTAVDKAFKSDYSVYAVTLTKRLVEYTNTANIAIPGRTKEDKAKHILNTLANVYAK